jgi:hypothetical protein
MAACFNPCARNWISLSRIYAILNTLFCSLCDNGQYCNVPKTQKFRAFECAVERLSRYSIDPRGAYAVFDGIAQSDPSKFLAVYIDDLRGDWNSNLNAYNIYHVTFCAYGDVSNICRTLIQPYKTISNSETLTGASKVENSVSQRLYRAQTGLSGPGEVVQPIGLTSPFAGNLPLGAVPAVGGIGGLGGGILGL